MGFVPLLQDNVTVPYDKSVLSKWRIVFVSINLFKNNMERRQFTFHNLVRCDKQVQQLLGYKSKKSIKIHKNM